MHELHIPSLRPLTCLKAAMARNRFSRPRPDSRKPMTAPERKAEGQQGVERVWGGE